MARSAAVGILALLVAVVCIAGAGAQERRLTLAEAISLAMAHSPALAVERHGIDVAGGEVTKAQSYPHNPELEVSPGLGGDRHPPDPGLKFAYDAQVGVSQTVELKGQGAIRLRRAKALADQAAWQVRDAERDARVQVLRAFSAVLLAQQRVRLASETVDLSRELLRVARELYEAGHVPRLDALRAEVEERLAANERTAAERALAARKRDLTLLMGQPSELSYEAVGPLAYGASAIVERALAENALSVRPDVKAVEAGLQASEAEIALVQAEQGFPAVSLSARYEFSREAEARQHRAVLGLSVPLPVFNRREGDLESAMARRSRQAARLALVKATISAQVAQALERFRASRRIVEQFTRHILPQQQANFEMLREGYQLGQFTLTEVLVMQREFIQGRARYLDAIADFNAALVDLEAASGTAVIDSNREP
jgi:cobalt-zinc-cadmium efflux system outer membrane protein